jgi:hypothetical protein
MYLVSETELLGVTKAYKTAAANSSTPGGIDHSAWNNYFKDAPQEFSNRLFEVRPSRLEFNKFSHSEKVFSHKSTVVSYEYFVGGIAS